jgi:carboxyl-terminal processing protease
MNNKSWTIFALLVVFAMAAALGAYRIGFQYGLQETQNIEITYLNAETPSGTTVDFSLFWQAWDRLKERHIDGGEVSDQALLYGAIEGLTGAYDDPNTNFFTPEDSQKFTEDIQGNFGGIGAEIGIKNNQLQVVAPLKGTPADQAGLKAGDKILEVDGEPTDGLTVQDAVKIIRGEIGSAVVLTIFQEDWNQTREIEITRANIQVPVVEWEMKEGNVAHLQIYSFSGTTSSAFNRAVSEAFLQGADRFVIDLRNNPGGLLDTAVDLAGWFLQKGSIVAIEEFSTGEEITFTARGNEALKNVPIVVLINEGSASASEILAGALQFNRDIPLVGMHSFGKGTVQQLESLKDGSTLKITVAHWLLPNGERIEKNGIAPDHEVDITEEDFENERDPQLDEALRIVNEL